MDSIECDDMVLEFDEWVQWKPEKQDADSTLRLRLNILLTVFSMLFPDFVVCWSLYTKVEVFWIAATCRKCHLRWPPCFHHL